MFRAGAIKHKGLPIGVARISAPMKLKPVTNHVHDEEADDS